ncbi:MAG: hypothetical protein K2L59_08505 [Muribaculaceae bacterium]|nr:hypothetical protein [Muribaculaceae bacterium]
MKRKKLLIGLLAGLGSVLPVSAQYGEIVNGLTNVALPLIRQSAGYKGYVEADYTQGFGNYRSNFLTLATSQGYKFSDWFYMGAGIGVDLLWSKVDGGWGSGQQGPGQEWRSHELTNSAVMIPVFTDFRFILGDQTHASFFINLRVGAAFLCSDSYVEIRDGYLTDRNYFYFQPAVGVRIPVNRTRPRQALDVGLHYRLMTSDYWSNWQYNAAINGIGLNISYEW